MIRNVWFTILVSVSMSFVLTNAWADPQPGPLANRLETPPAPEMGQPQWEEFKSPDGTSGVRLRLHSEPTATWRKGESFEVNVNETSMEVTLQNADFRRALQDFKVAEKVDAIISFNVKISSSPYLLGDYTKDRLEGKLDEKLKLVRSTQMEIVRGKVLEGLSKSPQYQAAPDAIKKQIYNQLYASAGKAVDEQLRVVRATKVDELGKRLKDIQLETAIQEVAVVVGKVVGDGKALIFMRAGKFHIENGPVVNENGQSELEDLRLLNSRVQRGGGSMGTGAIDLGWVQKFGEQTHLRTDLFLFHSRLPHIDANNDVATIVSLPDNEYDEHLKFWQLDSVALRSVLETDRIDLYFGVADHDGKFTANAGTTVRLTAEDTVFIDGYTGDRDYTLSRGASVFYARALTQRFSVYGGYTRAEDSWEPLISSVPLTYNEFTLGTAYKVVDYETSHHVHLELKLVAEGSERFYDGLPSSTDELSFHFGAEAQLTR